MPWNLIIDSDFCPFVELIDEYLMCNYTAHKESDCLEEVCPNKENKHDRT